MIQIQEVSFHYSPEHPVLTKVNLTIQEGEWLAVIGPNGSGKSTLARLMNGLLLPKQGQVLVDEWNTAAEDDLMRIREKVAFLFQNPDHQLVATTVEDDIAFGVENLGLPREEITRRVNEAIRILGLEALREKAPHLLSGGEKQRVALAGALVMASRYMVLDEPTSMLDPAMRKSFVATLTQLHAEQGLTMVYVTNLMEEALLADRIVLLDQGHMIADGTPGEIFSEPELLTKHHLSLPQIPQLVQDLATLGHPEFTGILTQEELVKRLCELN